MKYEVCFKTHLYTPWRGIMFFMDRFLIIINNQNTTCLPKATSQYSTEYTQGIVNFQHPWTHFGSIQDFVIKGQSWFKHDCVTICSELSVFCVLIYPLKPSQSRRWPDQDLQRLADCSVRNGPGWHVSAVINEQVFGSVLSKWSHYWWPQSSQCVASYQWWLPGPRCSKRGCCDSAGQRRRRTRGLGARLQCLPRWG